MKNSEQVTETMLPEEVKSFYTPSGKSEPYSFAKLILFGVLSLICAYLIAFLIRLLQFGFFLMTTSIFGIKNLQAHSILYIPFVVLNLILWFSPILTIPISFIIVFNSLTASNKLKCRHPGMSYYAYAIISPIIAFATYYLYGYLFLRFNSKGFIPSDYSTAWKLVVTVLITLLCFPGFICLSQYIRDTPFCENCNEKKKKKISFFLYSSIPFLLRILNKEFYDVDMQKKIVWIEKNILKSDSRPFEYATFIEYTCQCDHVRPKCELTANNKSEKRLLYSEGVDKDRIELLYKTDQMQKHEVIHWEKKNPKQNKEVLKSLLKQYIDAIEPTLICVGYCNVTNEQTAQLLILSATEVHLHILYFGTVRLNVYLESSTIENALNNYVNPKIETYFLNKLGEAYLKNGELRVRLPDESPLKMIVQMKQGLEATDSQETFFNYINKIRGECSRGMSAND